MKRARVLVVDDKGTYLTLFRRILPADTELFCAADGTRALALLATESFDVVITDVRMPGVDGLAVLRTVREASEHTAVVLMTAYGTIAEAVRAMKCGADDYLTKPFDTDEAVAAIERAMERRRARTATPDDSEVPPIVGESHAMVEVRELVSRAARSNACVLITGEGGTGKDLVARSIHECGRRSQRPFVTHIARSSSEGRLERDLEHAAGGTLYIDELFEIDGVVQARLSNLLEERLRKEDSAGPAARIIASSSVDLVAAAGRRLFREDVLRLVSETRIDLPALRLRREDIALLASALLARRADAESSPTLSSDAVDALVAHDWPGNVRQLEAVLLRVAAVAGPEPIEVKDLPAQLRSRAALAESSPPLTSLTYREVLAAGRDRTTRDYLVALLAAVGGNVTQAAERAGVERETFHRLLKRHGIRAEDFRSR
jgi:DNA-binding NtrC family response regulator